MHSVNTRDFARRVAERIDGISGGDVCLFVYREYELHLDREKSRLAIQTAFNRFVIRTLPPVLGDMFVSHHELDPSETSDTIVRIACIAEKSGVPSSPDAWKLREDLRRAVQFLFRSYVRSVTRDDVPYEDGVSAPPDAAVSLETGSETDDENAYCYGTVIWGAFLQNPQNVMEIAKAIKRARVYERQYVLDQIRCAVCKISSDYGVAGVDVRAIVEEVLPKPPSVIN
jgi:hypothetical protein